MRRTVTVSFRTLLLLAVGALALVPATAAAVHQFSDVADSNVHAPAIDWLADAAVTTGCGDGSTFCPDDPVTRAQMASFMHRLSGNAGTDPSVVAASAGTADFATDAGTVGGIDPAELALVTDVVLPVSAAVSDPGQTAVDATGEAVLTLEIDVPAPGSVLVHSSTTVEEVTAGDAAICNITDELGALNGHTQWWESPGADGNTAQLGGTERYDVTEDGTFTVHLFCRHLSGGGGGNDASNIIGPSMTAMYVYGG